MPERRTRPEAPRAGERLTRRAALAAAVGGAAGLAVAAAPARARGASEGEALTELIRAEEDAVFVYTEARLDGAAALAPQDTEHAKALASHLEALGMPVPGPTRDREDLAPEALAVLEATGAQERRRAAMAYERSLIAGVLERLPRLEAPNTVRTVATVMASHAQHLVLHELIGRG
jgi:hypothetical protein